MGLSVTTAARYTRLTTRAAVKLELGITASTDDALFDALIDRASAAIVSYCHRPFAREVYAEALPGFGDIHLQLARTPVVAVASVSYDGSVITDYSVADRDRGWLYRRAGWAWTAQAYPGLSASGGFLNIGSPLPRQEEPLFSVSYTAGYVLPSETLTATTISAVAADDSFNDSGAGFPTTLLAGDVVEVSGFSNAANNGRFVVTGTPTTTKITVSGALVDEAATPTVTVKPRPPAEVRGFDDVEKAAIETAKAWYLERKEDPGVVEKQVGALRIRRGESDEAMALGVPARVIGLLRPWVRAA